MNPTFGAIATVGLSSLTTSDELQSLLVGLLAVAVREFLYWLRNRNKPSSTLDTSSMG